MHFALKRIAVWLALTTALTAPGLALAQQDEEPDPNVSVQDRPRPEYDPLGIRAGSFFIFPSLTVEGEYDDNVFATDDDEEDDLGTIISPNIEVNSNFSRHAINGRLGAEVGRFLEFSSNNYYDFFSSIDGRLDITRESNLTGVLALDRLHEDRESADVLEEADDITEYWRGRASLAHRYNFNRIFTVLGAEFLRYDFQDPTDTINEDDRDRNQYIGRARLGYEISPRLAGFVQGVYDIRRYDETPDDTGRDRDSKGYGLHGGVEVDITGIMFGELFAGYTYRKYDDDDLDNAGGLGGGGSLTWNITPLTTIIASALAEIQETTVVFEGDEASADFEKTLSLDVTHELLRNVLLNANATYTRDDFEGTERSDDTFIAGAGVSYLLNRNLSLDATYRFSTRASDDETEEFTRNIVRLGVTARL